MTNITIQKYVRIFYYCRSTPIDRIYIGTHTLWRKRRL